MVDRVLLEREGHVLLLVLAHHAHELPGMESMQEVERQLGLLDLVEAEAVEIARHHRDASALALILLNA